MPTPAMINPGRCIKPTGNPGGMQNIQSFIPARVGCLARGGAIYFSSSHFLRHKPHSLTRQLPRMSNECVCQSPHPGQSHVAWNLRGRSVSSRRSFWESPNGIILIGGGGSSTHPSLRCHLAASPQNTTTGTIIHTHMNTAGATASALTVYHRRRFRASVTRESHTEISRCRLTTSSIVGWVTGIAAPAKQP